MQAKPAKAIGAIASEHFHLAAPAWGFAYSLCRSAKRLQPSLAARQALVDLKWHGTQHDHFFRLDLTGA